MQLRFAAQNKQHASAQFEARWRCARGHNSVAKFARLQKRAVASGSKAQMAQWQIAPIFTFKTSTTFKTF